MKVVVGIDGMVTPTLKTGIGRYIESLLIAFAAIKDDNKTIVYLGSNQEDLREVFSRYFLVRRSSISTECSLLNFLRAQIVLPVQALRDRLQVLHIPNEKLVFLKLCPVVLTIHDVGDFRVPERTDVARRIFRKVVLPVALARADHIIAVSQRTADDLVELFHVPRTKITVIPEGVSPKICRVEKERAMRLLRERWNIFSDYILFVGEVAVRKNLLNLVEAFDGVLKDHVGKIQLVIVGKEASATKDLNRQIRERGLEGCVTLTGFVDDQDMSLFYSAAEMLVLPSMYEGFGLPVVEAMASGIPVIVSQAGSLPEVVGTAGVVVDCSDVSALKDAMLLVLNDAHVRAQLIERGYERVKLYSWDVTARKTIEVYERVSQAQRKGDRDQDCCP
jgi:glycosyltransferase involved in cell wall biosynthesis